MSDVTHILSRIESGDELAAGLLLPLLYDELRRLAAQKLAKERHGHTLNPTALVHEAYLRLVGSDSDKCSLGTRAHFLAAAAQTMRNILVDHARRRSALKRGGGMERVDCELADLESPLPDEELVALHDAMNQLAELDPIKARLVELRYFVGLSSDEAARILEISTATADRHWAFARAWLQTAVRGEN